MSKKFSRLIEPQFQPFFLCLVLFILVTFPLQTLLALIEAVVLVVLFLFYRSQSRKRRHSMAQYMEAMAGGVDSVSRNSLLSTPLPMVVFHAEDGRIIWGNEGFLSHCLQGEQVFDMHISDVAPHFDYLRTVANGEAGELVEMNERSYQVYATISRLSGKSTSQVVTAYFVDVTEREHLRTMYDATRLVVCLVVLDNYEEMMKAGGEAAKSAVLAQIDERLNAWVQGSGGLLRKFDRDRYLFICDTQCYERLVEEKFSVLETMHQVVSEDGVNATVSIGIGKDCDTYEESFSWASKAIEMALSRGGDQAVVKDSLDFQFYGGRGKSTEKRTKVKSRVMAKALGELVADASEVYVMGHEFADMDAVGAAAGVCCVARKRGKKVRIVIDMDNNNAKDLVKKLRENPEYDGAFISGPDAFVHARPGALLVVVDTNRPDMVESQQLLDSCNRVAVIDHHRRAANYIESAALNFHEPYASSASELVTELLQYMVEPTDLLRAEAEALMAGIVLDTKNFMLRTGGRTFEAAAFLRRAGADMAEVRRYFQSDLASSVQRYDIIRNAELYHGDVAIALAEGAVSRVTASKAADDMLTLQGIQASIVLYGAGDGVAMSARSLGEINVQVIVEQLGGGGNSESAGGYIPNTDLDTVHGQLCAAIDAYFRQ